MYEPTHKLSIFPLRTNVNLCSRDSSPYDDKRCMNSHGVIFFRKFYKEKKCACRSTLAQRKNNLGPSLWSRLVALVESRSSNVLMWLWHKLLVGCQSAARALCLHHSLSGVRPFDYATFTSWSGYAHGPPGRVDSCQASRW
jgi:hypothetical protein